MVQLSVTSQPLPAVTRPLSETPAANTGDAALMDSARRLEASFLAEMLKVAGMHSTSESFGGGAGEEQFGSFLVRAHASAIAENGGIGLAETLFESLKENRDDATQP